MGSVFGRARRRQPIIFCALSGKLSIARGLDQQLSSERRIWFVRCHSFEAYGALKIFSQEFHRDFKIYIQKSDLPTEAALPLFRRSKPRGSQPRAHV